MNAVSPPPPPRRAAAQTAPDVRSLQQAAQWYATLRDENASEADRLAWQRWLRSPAHQAAWAHIEAVSRKFEPLRGYGPPGMAAAAAGGAAARKTALSRRRALNALSGTLSLGVLAWLGWRQAPRYALPPWADYRTGTGERRDLVLADGSRIWLNTGTALRVDYRPSLRRLVSLCGEVFIQTAVDGLQRPFCVDTAHGRLQALGTRFTVRQTDAGTRLDVFDGAVAIRTLAGQALRVQAGQAARFDARQITALAGADPMRNAWTRGVVLADDLPLGELLAELGRYRAGHIRVAPEVAGLRVMGVFPADDPERALAMLEQTLPIRVRRSLPWWITVQAR
ncbi:MAG: FecR domain-containing protein [Achromobacter sp.]|uniref:FecR domain-containing protein n=1 Tax=Achromobacter sp. TaxID=134375 RepID=UPI003D05BCF0